MNICFVEDTHLRGGTQIWVTEATKFFIDQGETVNVIAPGNSFVAKECSSHGAYIFPYDWEDIKDNSKKYKDIWMQGLAKSDIAITTVHPPRDNFHCSVFAAKCIKDGKLNAILIPKTGTIVPEYLREFYYPDPEVKTHVIAITDFTRRYLLENYKLPESMVTLIYQGTEIDRFTSTKESKEEAIRRYPFPKNAEPIVGSVGSFEPRKGQTILLKAIKKLSQDLMPNIHAMLVGEGPDEEMLKEKSIELGIENNVSFFPFTREPNYVFERLDILTLPSLYKEGLPNVLLEAMSMSIPCIATNIAGITEIIENGKTGYLITPGSVDELVGAIYKMWSDKTNYIEMGKRSRKIVEEKFDKKRQFFEFLKFFKELIK